MKITIRPAMEADFDSLIDLFSEFALFEKLPEKMTNTTEQMKLEKEWFNCFVAETDKREIVGYVTWFFAYYTWTGKSIYMNDLYVKPAYRGHGIGTKLISKVIETARQTRCNKLRWQVSSWNQPAIEFYKSLGASIDSTEQNCDLILM